MEVITGIRIFSVHYLWEDCVSMVLGILIALSNAPPAKEFDRAARWVKRKLAERRQTE
jgi:hypothetical protein